MQVRTSQGRDPEPSAAVIDSQSVHVTPIRGPEKGYDPGKKIYGRKRNVLVDTQGNLLAVEVVGAHRSDAEGARLLLAPLREVLPRMRLLWGDSHYSGEFHRWLREHLGWRVEVVQRRKEPKRGLLVPIEEPIDWEQLFPKGFQVLPRRWVVERTFAWFQRFRRLSKDFEGLPRCSEAFLKLAMLDLFLLQLTLPDP